MSQTFTVLTEEKPNIDEIRLMLYMIDVNISDSISNISIIPDITTNTEGKKMFKGVWNLVISDYIFIKIKLFKGKTSCVDYMLFSGDVDLTTGNANKALVILESTKTSDNDSRNTAVYQRITKFTTFETMYPGFKGIKVMFWCNSVWKKKITPTAILGMTLMATLNIHLYSLNGGNLVNIKEKYKIKAYECCDSIITSKNSIKEKRNNSNIRLLRRDDIIYISIKLDKGSGKSSGVISHDPNVGFLAAIINAFEKVKKTNCFTYIVQNHNIKQPYFDKCPRSKLWYSIHNVNIVFEGCVIKKKPVLPSKYFTLESDMTEKIATILYDYVSPNETIFSNHGGCALTCIKGHNDAILCVGQKNARPDIVFRNDERKEIEIIEGKLEKELGKGIKQLSNTHLEKFIEQLNKLYPDYTIKKGLCITIDSVDYIDKYENLEFPVKFAIDNEGFFIHLS